MEFRVILFLLIFLGHYCYARTLNKQTPKFEYLSILKEKYIFLEYSTLDVEENIGICIFINHCKVQNKKLILEGKIRKLTQNQEKFLRQLTSTKNSSINLYKLHEKREEDRNLGIEIPPNSMPVLLNFSDFESLGLNLEQVSAEISYAHRNLSQSFIFLVDEITALEQHVYVEPLRTRTFDTFNKNPNYERSHSAFFNEPSKSDKNQVNSNQTFYSEVKDLNSEIIQDPQPKTILTDHKFETNKRKKPDSIATFRKILQNKIEDTKEKVQSPNLNSINTVANCQKKQQKNCKSFMTTFENSEFDNKSKSLQKDQKGKEAPAHMSQAEKNKKPFSDSFNKKHCNHAQAFLNDSAENEHKNAENHALIKNRRKTDKQFKKKNNKNNKENHMKNIVITDRFDRISMEYEPQIRGRNYNLKNQLRGLGNQHTPNTNLKPLIKVIHCKNTLRSSAFNSDVQKFIEKPQNVFPLEKVNNSNHESNFTPYSYASSTNIYWKSEKEKNKDLSVKKKEDLDNSIVIENINFEKQISTHKHNNGSYSYETRDPFYASKIPWKDEKINTSISNEESKLKIESIAAKDDHFESQILDEDIDISQPGEACIGENKRAVNDKKRQNNISIKINEVSCLTKEIGKKENIFLPMSMEPKKSDKKIVHAENINEIVPIKNEKTHMPILCESRTIEKSAPLHFSFRTELKNSSNEYEGLKTEIFKPNDNITHDLLFGLTFSDIESSKIYDESTVFSTIEHKPHTSVSSDNKELSSAKKRNSENESIQEGFHFEQIQIFDTIETMPWNVDIVLGLKGMESEYNDKESEKKIRGDESSTKSNDCILPNSDVVIELNNLQLKKTSNNIEDKESNEQTRKVNLMSDASDELTKIALNVQDNKRNVSKGLVSLDKEDKQVALNVDNVYEEIKKTEQVHENQHSVSFKKDPSLINVSEKLDICTILNAEVIDNKINTFETHKSEDSINAVLILTTCSLQSGVEASQIEISDHSKSEIDKQKHVNGVSSNVLNLDSELNNFEPFAVDQQSINKLNDGFKDSSYVAQVPQNNFESTADGPAIIEYDRDLKMISIAHNHLLTGTSSNFKVNDDIEQEMCEDGHKHGVTTNFKEENKIHRERLITEQTDPRKSKSLQIEYPKGVIHRKKIKNNNHGEEQSENMFSGENANKVFCTSRSFEMDLRKGTLEHKITEESDNTEMIMKNNEGIETNEKEISLTTCDPDTETANFHEIMVNRNNDNFSNVQIQDITKNEKQNLGNEPETQKIYKSDNEQKEGAIMKLFIFVKSINNPKISFNDPSSCNQEAVLIDENLVTKLHDNERESLPMGIITQENQQIAIKQLEDNQGYPNSKGLTSKAKLSLQEKSEENQESDHSELSTSSNLSSSLSWDYYTESTLDTDLKINTISVSTDKKSSDDDNGIFSGQHIVEIKDFRDAENLCKLLDTEIALDSVTDESDKANALGNSADPIDFYENKYKVCYHHLVEICNCEIKNFPQNPSRSLKPFKSENNLPQKKNLKGEDLTRNPSKNLKLFKSESDLAQEKLPPKYENSFLPPYYGLNTNRLQKDSEKSACKPKTQKTHKTPITKDPIRKIVETPPENAQITNKKDVKKESFNLSTSNPNCQNKNMETNFEYNSINLIRTVNSKEKQNTERGNLNPAQNDNNSVERKETTISKKTPVKSYQKPTIASSNKAVQKVSSSSSK